MPKNKHAHTELMLRQVLELTANGKRFIGSIWTLAATRAPAIPFIILGRILAARRKIVKPWGDEPDRATL